MGAIDTAKTLMSLGVPPALAAFLGTHYNASSYTSLVAAVALGENIVITEDITLTGNVTIASTQALNIIPGGIIRTNGFTLTINGPFEAGAYQTFSTTAGEVVFGRASIKEVLPEWFGAVGDNSTDCTAAFSKAIAAINTNLDGRILVLAGIYRHTGITLGASQSLYGVGAKLSVLRYTPSTGNGITLSAGAANTSYNNIFDIKLDCLTTSTGKAIAGPADPYYLADVSIGRYEIEGFLVGIYLPYGLHVEVGFGRLAGQGKAVANGVGVQLGDRTLGTPRLVNTGQVKGAYCSGYHTSFVLDGSILGMTEVVSENCTRAVLFGCRVYLSNSWIQADTTLYESRAGGWWIGVYDCYHLNATVEVDDVYGSGMCTLSSAAEFGFIKGNDIIGGQPRMRAATAIGRGLKIGATSNLELYSASGSLRVYSDSRPLELNRNAAGGVTLMAFYQEGVVKGYIGMNAAGELTLENNTASGVLSWDNLQNVQLGLGSLATGTMTSGLTFIASCAGAPTGVPTAKSGYVPLIVDTTNNKLYFYSGGAWRDAGP